MADSMEVHAEEVGQPTDELVVQDPDFDGETCLLYTSPSPRDS